MLQRDFKLFRRGVLPALVLTLLLALCCAGAAFVVLKSASEERTPVRFAVVDLEDSAFSGLALGMVEQQDFMQSLLTMEEVTEEEARQGVKNGTYAAALLLPAGFTGAIRTGTEGHCILLLSDAAASAGDMIQKICDFGGLLLAAGQYGVFAGEELIARKGYSDRVYKTFLTASNLKLMNYALDVYETGFTLREVPYQGTSLTLTAYYVLCWVILFFLLCGLFFPNLYGSDLNNGLWPRLCSAGISRSSFLAGKVLFPLLYRIVLGLPLLWVLGHIVPLSLTAAGLLGLFLALLLSSLYFSLAELLLAGKKGGAGVLLSVCLVGLTLSGGMIPLSMLPNYLRTIGTYTPSGVLARLMAPLFGGLWDSSALVPALLWLLLLLYLTGRLLKSPLRKGENA